MPSSWFRGGTQKMISQDNYWVSATLNCALVGNGSTNAPLDINVGDHSAITLQDFLNLGNTLIGTGDTVIPNRVSSWSPGNQQELRFSGQVNLGSINSLDPISGVVVYEGARATPSTATVVLASKFLTVGGGSTVFWGNTGVNIPSVWTPLTNSNSTAFRGTIENLINVSPEPWLSNTFKVGFALVRETGITTPSQAIQTLDELGATYCSGAAPNNPTKEVNLVNGFERQRSWNQLSFQGQDWFRASEGSGGTEIRWSFTGDNLVAGEVIDAVITYIYSGTFSTATAILLNWNEANYTIQSGEDIIYGATATANQSSVAVLTPELA